MTKIEVEPKGIKRVVTLFGKEYTIYLDEDQIDKLSKGLAIAVTLVGLGTAGTVAYVKRDQLKAKGNKLKVKYTEWKNQRTMKREARRSGR